MVNINCRRSRVVQKSVRTDDNLFFCTNEIKSIVGMVLSKKQMKKIELNNLTKKCKCSNIKLQNGLLDYL